MGSRPTHPPAARRWVGESDLTRIFEISPRRAGALRGVGIRSFEDLSRCDAKRVAKDLSESGMFISTAQVERMRCHVRSYREERAIRCGPLPSLGDEFVALDLEYDIHEPRIWIIGLYLVENGRCEHVALWAEDGPSERAGLKRMGELLGEMPAAPVLTWGGIRADFPQLRGACDRLELHGLLEGFQKRHIDLYSHVREGLRLPIPSLALDHVAAFFEVTKTSPIGDGLEALNLYRKYRTRYSPRVKKQIREELVTYNRDDLEALVATLRAIEELPMTPDGEEASNAARPLQESFDYS